MLSAADRIAARLCESAAWDGGACTWTVDASGILTDAAVASHRLGPDLYTGTAGIAWFLAHLHAFAPHDDRTREVARGALSCAVDSLDSIPRPIAPGLYVGLSGIALALVRAGDLIDEPDFCEHALVALRRATACLTESAADALVDGVAGIVPALLAAHAWTGASWLIDAAVDAGERLVRRACRTSAGCFWPIRTDSSADAHLTGFSHGAAGIGWALCELFAATGEPAFRDTALDAMRYENRCFDVERQNWRDRRHDEVYSMSWCHGAPGIGMARLRAYEVLGVDWLLADAEAALGSTIADLESRVTAPLSNLCLCHGVAGNVDLLLLAARILNRAPLVDTARRLSALAWDACDAAEVWPCGPKMATGIAAPFAGLMAGLAGLGYSRLRLLAPDRIPSTLMPSPCVLASAVRTDVIAGVPTT